MNSFKHKLICPKCKKRLKLHDSILDCGTHEFAINENYINFIDKPNQQISDTIEAASYRWSRSSKLEDDQGFMEHQLNDFLHRYGFENLDYFKQCLRNCRSIAEIGAGEGRMVDWLLQYSEAQTIYALELSNSAKYLAQKYLNEPRVIVIQCDAQNHPFADESLDALFCDQSIHHCDSPKQTFSNLTAALVNKGYVFLSVYARKSSIREKFDHLIRDAISEKNNEDKFLISNQITEIGKILSEIDVDITVPDNYSEFGELCGHTISLQRLLYYSVFKCFWNNNYTFSKSAEINFDWYSYPSSHKIPVRDIVQWFTTNNISIQNSELNFANNNFRGQKTI